MSQSEEQASPSKSGLSSRPGLAGKVALVTGGAQGIGRASALLLAEAGAHVVIADLAMEAARQTVERIRAGGGTADSVSADVTREADVTAMIEFAISKFGGLDIAHNNAGGGIRSTPLLECTEEHFDRVVDFNLKSAFLCMKYELRHMVGRGAGAIVNTAAAASYRGGVAYPAYTAAKHGLAGLTKAAAIEVAMTGVRVNAVGPGFTMTDGVVERLGGVDTVEARARAAMPVGRPNGVSDIAAAVLFLCSDAAAGITGVVLPVDGGMSAQ